MTLPTAASAPAIAPTLLLSGGPADVVVSGGAVVLSGVDVTNPMEKWSSPKFIDGLKEPAFFQL